jgi:ketosteroid isomerase-like protein
MGHHPAWGAMRQECLDWGTSMRVKWDLASRGNRPPTLQRGPARPDAILRGPMSQRNVEIVQSVLEPLRGANLAAIDWDARAIREGLGRAYSPEIELTTLASGAGSGVGEHYRGLDGLAQYLGEWLEPFSDYEVDNLEYIEAGDCVIVPSRQWGVGSGSGARVELELTTLFELRDGQIARMHQFDTTEEALEAAEGG